MHWQTIVVPQYRLILRIVLLQITQLHVISLSHIHWIISSRIKYSTFHTVISMYVNVDMNTHDSFAN